MSKRKRKPKKFKIKDIEKNTNLDLSKVFEADYPVFCFKHLSDTSIKKCEDSKFFYYFLMRLKKLSHLGWKEIRKSPKHSFGMEKIPANKIIPQLPNCITPEVEYLHVFRAQGNNLPFVGLVTDKVFRVFFIETKFGDIYKH